jgi:autotransporter-associated beta strand protein
VLTISNTTAGGVASLAIAGGISGTGAVTFGAANEAGTYVLSGSNSYTGLTRIDAGRVQIASGGWLGSSAGIVVGTANSAGAILDLTEQGSQVAFAAGQTISGKGTIELAPGAVLSIPGLLSPGNSPGNLSILGGLAWQSTDAGYVWEINDALGTAGSVSSGWDLVTASGALDLTALTSSARYSLDLTTLTTGNVAGQMANYIDGGSYRWSLVSSAGGVLLLGGTAAADADVTDLFNVSFTNWQNPVPSVGNYSVRVASDGLGLDFVVVPEPTSVALVGFAFVAGVAAYRRRRA